VDQRRLLVRLTACAGLAAVVQGVSGLSELTLYLTPLFLIAALLLSGRYVAEDRIVRRWRASAPRRPRARSHRRPAAARTIVASRLEHTPRLERGPPAFAAA
jgi:hypothetical protein